MYTMGMWCGWCGAKARNPDFLPTLTALNGSRGGSASEAPYKARYACSCDDEPGTAGAGPFKVQDMPS